MFRITLHYGFFVFGGFCAILLILRIWPHDDHDLWMLMLSKDCPAPCFMGIQPGLTTPDEAIVLLQKHEWVAPNSVQRTTGGEVLWSWSGQQPVVINPTRSPLLIVWASTRDMQVVNGIQLPLKLPVGYAFLALGEPPILGIGQGNNRAGATVIALYEHYALEIWAQVSCPITRRKFLESPLNLFWISIPERPIGLQRTTGRLSC